MARLLYIGIEGFSIPAPPKTTRQATNPPTFLVIREVGEELRRIFNPKDELRYINRFRSADQITRVQFANLSLEPMEFKPQSVSEVGDDMAELFLRSRYWQPAPADGVLPDAAPMPNAPDYDDDQPGDEGDEPGAGSVLTRLMGGSKLADPPNPKPAKGAK